MTRRQAREAALQTLFQLELNPPPDALSEEAWQGRALEAALKELPTNARKNRDYAAYLVQGTRQNLVVIDDEIAASSREWKLGRMMGVDRNIVRMALYEMKYGKEKMDVGIVINEAVELAKKFGTDDSSRYVNGLLGKLARCD